MEWSGMGMEMDFRAFFGTYCIAVAKRFNCYIINASVVLCFVFMTSTFCNGRHEISC